jgi:hypothetical protein
MGSRGTGMGSGMGIDGIIGSIGTGIRVVGVLGCKFGWRVARFSVINLRVPHFSRSLREVGLSN